MFGTLSGNKGFGLILPGSNLIGADDRFGLSRKLVTAADSNSKLSIFNSFS